MDAHCQDRAKCRYVVEAEATKLNEEAEEMEKMKNDKRKERREKSNYQIKPAYSVLNLVAPLQHKTRQVFANHQRQKHGAEAQI